MATDIAELTPQGLFYYPGSYEQYLEEKKIREGSIRVVETKEKRGVSEKDQNKDVQKNIRELEQRITKLEKKIAYITEQIGMKAEDYEASKQLVETLGSLQKELKVALAEWEALT